MPVRTATTSASALMVPAATNFLIPATVVALAGSQPMPQAPMAALASAISCSVARSTTARRWSSEVKQFAEGFAVCADVAEVAAGEDDPIGYIPIALIEHFDDDRLLAFDAEGVDRIQKINAEAFGDDANKG